MKVRNRKVMEGYSGTLDGMIYYVDRRTGATLARRTFTFKKHPGQPPFRKAQKQIYAINPSDGYKRNLTDYIIAFNKLPENEDRKMSAWTNAYNKIMYGMQKALPGKVDLKTITRAQIYSQNLPCRTVKAAVDAGLLPKVRGYQRWAEQI